MQLSFLPPSCPATLKNVVTALKICDLLPPMTQATSDGIQLSGSLLEACVDTFVKLEDKVV